MSVAAGREDPLFSRARDRAAQQAAQRQRRAEYLAETGRSERASIDADQHGAAHDLHHGAMPGQIPPAAIRPQQSILQPGRPSVTHVGQPLDPIRRQLLAEWLPQIADIHGHHDDAARDQVPRLNDDPLAG